MDLDDLLDEIKAEQPKPVPRTMSARAETFSYGDHLRVARWKPEDKLPSHVLELSEYERTWLITRIQVHLKSYEHYEWSEMKDVLQSVLKRLEVLAHGKNNPGTTSETPYRDAKSIQLSRSVDPLPHAQEPGELHSDGPEAGGFPDCPSDEQS